MSMLFIVWMVIVVVGTALVAISKPVVGLGLIVIGIVVAAVEALVRLKGRESAARVPSVEAVDPEGRGLYIAGGISMVLVGFTFIAEIALAVALGRASPGTLAALSPSSRSLGAPALVSVASHAALIKPQLAAAVPSDSFFVVAALALYVALRRANRNAILVAVAFLSLYIILDLGVNAIGGLPLVTISQNYAAATTDAERAGYLAVANYIHALGGLSLPISSGVMSVGILIAGLVMRKSIFGKISGNLGVVTAILGIAYGITVALPILAIFAGLSSYFETLWFLLVGAQLIWLGVKR